MTDSLRLRRLRVVAGGMALLFVLGACVVFARTPSLWPQYREANGLITRIDRFAVARRRVPADLAELDGVPETIDDAVHYRRLTDTRYELSFGRSLRESYVYDSASRDWR